MKVGHAMFTILLISIITIIAVVFCAILLYQLRALRIRQHTYMRVFHALRAHYNIHIYEVRDGIYIYNDNINITTSLN